MKVVLDARWIFPEISGIGLYTQALIQHLVRLDQETRYVLLFDRTEVMDRVDRASGFRDAGNFEARLTRFGPLGVRNQLQGPSLLRSFEADVYHSPNYLIPLAAFPSRGRGRLRSVVTLHDVIPLVFPDHAPRSLKRRLFPLYKALMRHVGRTADAIITVSRSSKQDLIRYLELPPSRHPQVRVIYNGVADVFRPQDSPPPSPGLAPRDRILLFVGRMDPYKNLVALIEAVGVLRRQGVLRVRLRIVGPRDPRYPEAEARARALGLSDVIDWAGYLDNHRLVEEYQRADVFVMPSRYEGFGLPVLEAMACGVPVICGNTSSLPEVAGDAAIQVEPNDVAGLAAAIRTVLEDEATARRLRERGRRQAAAFSWRRSAAETLQTYRDVAAAP